jgi:hypothetical protein
MQAILSKTCATQQMTVFKIMTEEMITSTIIRGALTAVF